MESLAPEPVCTLPLIGVRDDDDDAITRARRDGEKIVVVVHSSFCCPTRRSTARLFLSSCVYSREQRAQQCTVVAQAQISFDTQRYT